MTKDSLGDRMKNNYEDRAKTYLTRRTPVIIRLDGKAFHTFTRGCVKPYDEDIIEAMKSTAEYLIKNIQGAKISFVQSDEISLLLTDYDELDTNAWYDYSVQKICSVTASMTSVYFTNRYDKLKNLPGNIDDPKFAFFDSRCFNIPKEEVVNYFRWRFMDWTRNSISMLAQANFSHKELQGKNRQTQLNMLKFIGKDWNDCKPIERLGTTIIKTEDDYRTEHFDWLDKEDYAFAFFKETLGI